MQHTQSILLTGIHRSGSTFAGRMLSLPCACGYIDEPFNFQYGIEGVDEWFPYAREDGEDDPLDLFDDVVAGRAIYRRPEMALRERSLTHRIGRVLLKSRLHIAYQLFRANPLLSRTVVKDPFLCFLSERLHRERGLPVVILVRHPAAFAASVRRCGFHFDVRNLMQNQALMDDFFGSVLGRVDPQSLSELEHAAWVWRCVYSVLFTFLERNPAMIPVRHEDLSTDPVTEFSALYKKLDLPFSMRIQKKIARITDAENPSIAPDNKVHHLQRDSRGLVDRWKTALSAEEIQTVRSITGETASPFYPEF